MSEIDPYVLVRSVIVVGAVLMFVEMSFDLTTERLRKKEDQRRIRGLPQRVLRTRHPCFPAVRSCGDADGG